MRRDFSESSKQRLLSLVSEVENEKWSDFTDWIGDRWYDFEAWIGMLNIRNYLNNVNAYHKKVIDKNNMTKVTIESIFKEVNMVDNRYGNSCFKFRKAQLCMWNRYIEKLSEIVNPANGKFTAEYVSSMREVLEECISQIDCKPTTEEMYPALIEFDVTRLALDSRETWKDALVLWWTDDWRKNITSIFTKIFGFGENVNELAVRESIESVIAEMIKDKSEIIDRYEEYADALMPEGLEMEKRIIDHFLKTGKVYTKSELADLLDMDVTEFGNSEIFEWLNKRVLHGDNLEFLNKISDKLDKTIGLYGDTVDTFELISQTVSKALHNYEENAKYLEAIKSALIDGGYDNKTVNDVVDSMLWECQNQHLSAVKDIADEVTVKGIDKAIDEVLPWLNVFLETKDISSDLIGLKDKADDIAQIYATQQYSYGLVEKYELCRQKIKSGIYTRNDVKQCNIYFGLAKAAKLQEYKAVKATIESALNSANASLFSSAEDKQYTRDILVKIDAEIARLESLSI